MLCFFFISCPFLRAEETPYIEENIPNNHDSEKQDPKIKKKKKKEKSSSKALSSKIQPLSSRGFFTYTPGDNHPPSQEKSLKNNKKKTKSFFGGSFSGKNVIFSTNNLPKDFSLAVLEKFIKTKQYKKASLYVNRALRQHLKNSSLHTINGIIYEEMAKHSQHRPYFNYARAAYLTAHRLDSQRWYPIYALGLLEYNSGDYALATQHLAEAFRLNPQDKDIGLVLTQAAYGARDLNLAYENAQNLMRHFPDCPRVWRHGAILYAVGGEFANALHTLEQYKKLSGVTDEDVGDVCEKIHQWRTTHRLAFTQRAMSKGPFFIKPPVDKKTKEGDKEKEEDQDKDKDKDHEEKKKDEELMKNPIVVFEGYIIALVDTDVLNIGNNILNPVDQDNNLQDLGFLLGFDRTLDRTFESIVNANEQGNIPMPSQQNNTTGNFDSKMTFDIGNISGGRGGTDTINYSLNLINAQNECLLISARPSVSALLGQKVTFSDFNRVNGMVGGSSINVEAGVKIEFKPIQVQDNRVLLFISSTHSYLNPGYNLGKSLENQIISVSKVVSATTTEVKSGESILISGYSQDTDKAFTRGLPGVESIPLVGWFFSRREKAKDRRRVLFLITVYISDEKPLNPKDYKKDPYFGTRRPVLDRVLEFFENKDMDNMDQNKPFVNYALIEEMPDPNGVQDKRDVNQRLKLAIQGV